MSKIKKPRVKKIKINPNDIPFDPPYNIDRDYTPEITNICQRYIINDQTWLIKNTLDYYSDHSTEGFEDKDYKNYDAHKFLAVTNWYYIYNDLAIQLEKHGELILQNTQGTWWGISIKEGDTIFTNKTLIAIINEIEQAEIDRQKIVEDEVTKDFVEDKAGTRR
jgi:hypothetical protein